MTKVKSAGIHRNYSRKKHFLCSAFHFQWRFLKWVELFFLFLFLTRFPNSMFASEEVCKLDPLTVTLSHWAKSLSLSIVFCICLSVAFGNIYFFMPKMPHIVLYCPHWKRRSFNLEKKESRSHNSFMGGSWIYTPVVCSCLSISFICISFLSVFLHRRGSVCDRF